jgi:putative endonuclease
VGLGNASVDHQPPSNLGRPRNTLLYDGLRSYYNAPVHFVYIVRCADGTLYTGYARDPKARADTHNTGRGAKYTAGRRPVELVYTQKFRTRTAALRREYQLKRWTRAEKVALISR